MHLEGSIGTSLYLVALIFCYAEATAVKAASRIVGGEEITIDKVPYIVQIRHMKAGTFCGGTLVAPKYVISAGHCFENKDITRLMAVGGATTATEKGVRRRIVKVTKHPEFTLDTYHSDIVVVELATEMKGDNIKPIPLCSQLLKEGDFIQVSGWGKQTENQEGITTHLRTVRLPVASKESCDNEFAVYVKKNMFCASGLEPKGHCTGDSGGPAVFKGQLCGVVSFQYKCGVVGAQSVYSDVFALLPFIKKVMEQ